MTKDEAREALCRAIGGAQEQALREVMDAAGDTWEDVVHCMLSNSERLDLSTAGTHTVPPFLLWTYERVYVPIYHKRKTWIMAIPRYPQEEEEG